MDRQASERKPHEELKIGQLSKLAGLPVATLRFYEEQGILRPMSRTASGYRLYDEEALRRLQFVSRARALGMSLRSIATILDVAESGRSPCEHVGAAVCEQLKQVDEQLSQLTTLRSELIELQNRLAAVPREASDACGICPCVEEMPGTRSTAGVRLARRA